MEECWKKRARGCTAGRMAGAEQAACLVVRCISEHLGDGRDGLALGVHINMRIDIHGDLGAVVAGELLHHLGVNSLDGEQGQVGVPELVQAPSVEAELRAILGPPAAEARGQDACAGVVRNHGAIVGLLDVALLGLAPLVRPCIALELGLLVGLEHMDSLVRERQHAGAGLGLGCLEVSHVVVGVANVGDFAVEVESPHDNPQISPRSRPMVMARR